MGRHLRLFCMGLQLPRKPFLEVNEYRTWIETALQEVRPQYGSGANLLVFPEYLTLPLWLLEAGHFQVPLFSELAKKEGVHFLMCGPWQEGETLRNMAALIAPNGSLLWQVGKRWLTGEEERYGVCPSEQGEVHVVAGVKLGIAICLDGFNEGYIQGLAGQGAEVILLPSANPQPWRAPARGSGIWQPLEWARGITEIVGQEPIRYLINPMLQGRLTPELDFDGQSSIILASNQEQKCPYPQVDERFKAQFIFLGKERSQLGHSLGWVDVV